MRSLNVFGKIKISEISICASSAQSLCGIALSYNNKKIALYQILRYNVYNSEKITKELFINNFSFLLV